MSAQHGVFEQTKYLDKNPYMSIPTVTVSEIDSTGFYAMIKTALISFHQSKRSRTPDGSGHSLSNGSLM